LRISKRKRRRLVGGIGLWSRHPGCIVATHRHKREDVALAERTETPVQGGSAEDFGANAWLVEEMWKQFQVDKNSVDQAWWPVLEQYGAAQQAPAAPAAPAPAQPAAPAAAAPAAQTAAAPARTTNVAPRTAPIPADAPRAK